VEDKLGTGALLAALQAGEVDLIVALSEGLVSAIAQGAPVRILGTYVESPLCWAISTAGKAQQQQQQHGQQQEQPQQRSPVINEVADLRGQKIGISRFTSGSHLMSCVLATQRGWKQDDLAYVVEGNFEALRASVNEGKTAAFMWESFTTKPFHDSGEVRRIGEIYTPWPCFLLASATKVLDDADKRRAIRLVRQAVQEACRLFRNEAGMATLVSQRYGLRAEDAAEWYAQVRITASEVVSESTLEQPLQALKDAAILTRETYPKDLPLSHFVDEGEFVRLEPDIRSKMRLYHRPELLVALHNNLRAMGKDKGPLSFRDLLPVDQNHYGGLEALDRCIQLCGLNAQSRVLQLGSSVGGPARYLAASLAGGGAGGGGSGGGSGGSGGGGGGCEVLAVELQEDLSATGRELTARCGLQDKVHHMSGNILQVGPHLSAESYTCIASWLTQLHFDRVERRKLFDTAFRLLKPGGVLYAEDFFARAEFNEAERRVLRDSVFCHYCPSLATYVSELSSSGFVVEVTEDLTEAWVAQTRQRAQSFQEQRERQLKVHGEEIVDSLALFYEEIAALFEGGHVGGVRLLCRKPGPAAPAPSQPQQQLQQAQQL
jgi:ABC-type nitrate/sulfonate/bicarbonate transport system substrate-binding protein/cyclopropane fatty-acyl-phospholipid synthase-like methyltransferase